MRPLEHVLSNASLVFGSNVDPKESESGAPKTRDPTPTRSKKKNQPDHWIKPTVLSDNIFSEQETKRAKKIFMSRLSDYLDAQQSNKTGFDISTLGMEKLPKKLV